jgi:NTE family protein
VAAATDTTGLSLPLETNRADGVFEGGGVKGIAFVGALEVAAEAGIEEWVNVAGTSAGAIVASLLAVGYSPAELRTILEQTEYAAFADYGWGGRWIGGARNALLKRGLCPGRAFMRWLEERFAESPLGKADATFADLERRDLPDTLTPEQRARGRFKLRVIASDVTEGRMLVLPDDVGGSQDEKGRDLKPEELALAAAVRMSMSFPYFFEPVTLYRNGRPHLIVDGGLLSNFPVFLFDGDRPPLKRWTFGFRLYGGHPPEAASYRRVPRALWPIPLAKAMFFAATEAWDRRMSAATVARTISIPTGSVPTLKFTLTEDERDELSRYGAEAAREFFSKDTVYRNHAGLVAAGPARLTH